MGDTKAEGDASPRLPKRQCTGTSDTKGDTKGDVSCAKTGGFGPPPPWQRSEVSTDRLSALLRGR